MPPGSRSSSYTVPTYRKTSRNSTAFRKTTGCIRNLRKWTAGSTARVPDAGKVGGRLTRAVEKAYESICGSPSRVYIEGLYKELLLLGGMTVRKDYDDPVHYNPGFFDKYGIDRKAPRETILRQVEQAYRELDSRFSRSDADELFGKPKEKQAVQPRKENPDRPAPGIRPCRPKGRRMGF